MNEQEAIKEAIQELNYQKDSYDWEVTPKNCDLAISALEKQVGKKPRIDEYGWYCCPNNCNDKALMKRLDKYCNNCGQKLDWGEQE